MEISAGQLAALVKGKLEGNADVIINNFAKIEDAVAGCITFLANPKYTHYIYSTGASVVLVRDDFQAEQPVKATLIRVPDPYATLADLLNIVALQRAPKIGVEQPCFIADGVEVPDDAYIGAFSYIGHGATLGSGVKIYPHAYIGDGCSIGDNTIIRSSVNIYEGCSIGKRCIIHSGAVIGADGFGFAPKDGAYEKIPQIGNVIIEDDVEIGANTTVDRATFGSTVVGKGTKLDNLIQVAHNVNIGQHNVIAAQTGIAGSTRLGSYNRIGGQVGFAGHISIGDFNEIGAQSGIPNKVGDHKRIIGYPAIEARDFAKNQVYIKKLGDLFSNPEIRQILRKK